MTTKTFIAICLFGLCVPCGYAYQSSPEFISIFSMEEEEKLPLQIKKNENEIPHGKPDRRTLIPEVTLQNRELSFITPCNGCIFRLVQNDIVCYSTEVTGNILTSPSAFTGIYELQIVSGEYIFYTEVDL